MSSYKLVNLKTMIDEIGEVNAKEALSDFSCALNRDVESYLHEKAINFAKQNISQTHLVMAPLNIGKDEIKRLQSGVLPYSRYYIGMR